MPTMNLGRVRFNWRGAYDPNTNYLEYDCVEDDGQSYVCLADVTGTGPNDTGGGTYWGSMLVSSADYNQARQDAIDAAAAASDSATAAGNSEINAGDSATAASNSATKADEWANEAEDVEVEAGKFSAYHWMKKAQSFGDPNAFNVTADQTSDTRRLDEWAGQARANQQKLATAYRLGNGAFATDSGAADSYVLSVNYDNAAPTAYNDGDQYRFRAGAANTGASTVNINGLGDKTLVTVTGVTLPAGYIRTDADTTITFDAANDRFVADREVETGANVNGTTVRWANGKQECINVREENIAIASGPVDGFYYANVSWTFPASFSRTAVINMGVRATNKVTPSAQGGPGEIRGATSSVVMFAISPEEIPEQSYLVSLSATGFWYES